MRAIRLLVLLGLVAGCVSSPPEGGEGPRREDVVTDPYDFAGAIVVDHDHADPALHQASFGMALVGHAPLEGRAGTVPGGFTEVAVAGTWAFVANYGPDRGFSIVDVSDPAAPVHVADFDPARAGPIPLGGGTYWDVSVTPEADLVILSAQAGTGAAFGPGAGGVYLVNVEDKASPVVESFTPVLDPGALLAVGVHNANPFLAVDGVLHVAATTGNGATHLLRVEGEAPRRTLREVAVVAGTHDSAVQVHPLTNQTLLYSAHGGVFIWDVGDPAHPAQVAFVPDGPNLQTYHQTIPSDVLLDGRHYTVAATENADGFPTPFTLLDTTDPENPVVKGQWILPLPETPRASPYRFSGHNLDFDRGRLYVGHYHAGVWVVDVSNASLVDAPRPVAFHQPHAPPAAAPKALTGRDVPSVWGAVRHEDGLVYAADALTGLHILRPPPDAPHLAGVATYPTNVR